MKTTIISVTKASRNFSDCVNRVECQNITVVLLKNGSPVARLVPYSEKVCTGYDLAEALAKTRLHKDEAKAWRRDMKTTRKMLKTPSLKCED